ncbi:MAG: class I SAM-dependent methyltransferase [Clostridia bacterium]|nr:class I SAM-dependent methyltransferase [Clostridia bacterium]
MSEVEMEKKFEYTWEEAIQILRKDPQYDKFIYYSYLTDDILANCKRFYVSTEFDEVKEIIKREMPQAKKVLDLAAGNGIATYAFAISGFDVVALEPDPSKTVGYGAIEYVKTHEKIDSISIITGYGENIPIEDEMFDVVYVRQALHHAKDLGKMLKEIFRILKKGGLLVATREHVVDDYSEGLKKFLDNQPDHQLYGGENAFKHEDYVNAIKQAGGNIICDFGPYDNIINLFPRTKDIFKHEIVYSKHGKLLSRFLPEALVFKIGVWVLKKKKVQGRLHSFVARK